MIMVVDCDRFSLVEEAHREQKRRQLGLSAEALDSELKGCLGAPTGVCKKTRHQSQSRGINEKHYQHCCKLLYKISIQSNC